MATLFLIIIYLAFISLGLPDSLLGVAWPVMHGQMGAPMELAGLISMIIAGGTIISSLASGFFIKHVGTGKITLISCVMTAGALLGFYFAPSLMWLFLFSIPLGLGAGTVDAALNNYVANHYKAHHMSWLHCFWGVGATIGPIIMSFFISKQEAWRSGYLTVAIIQFTLVIALFLTLPLWKRMEKIHTNNAAAAEDIAESVEAEVQQAEDREGILRIKGVKVALISFLFYCGTEATMGLWGSSFLVNIKDIPAAIAAAWVSLYYAGITVGRLITGFITMKLSNKILIRCGQLTAFSGALLLLLPFPDIFSLIGFILVGLGCAPIYPCMLHETPVRFGKENSHVLMGFQMACAYTGSTFLPPLLGFIAAKTTIVIFPFFVLFYIVSMLAGAERINKIMKYKLKEASVKEI